MSIDKKELVSRVSKRVIKGTGTVEEIIDATMLGKLGELVPDEEDEENFDFD